MTLSSSVLTFVLTADHDGNLPEHAARLDAWIAQARNDTAVPALRSFAEGLLIDHDAVATALALPFSNGPTEGRCQQDQTPQTTDLRPRRTRPAPKTDTPCLTTPRHHGNLGRTVEITVPSGGW